MPNHPGSAQQLGLKTLVALFASLAAAASLAEPVEVKLPAQSLSSALRDLAIQTGVQVVIRTELIEGKMSAGLSGRYEPNDAFSALLQGTGLAAYPINSNTFGIREANAVPTAIQLAQDVTPRSLFAQNGRPVAAASSTAATNDEPLEEVMITGSRVITNGNESPTPVTVISVDQLLDANPGNIATAMQMLPSLMGTPTQGGQSSTNFQAVLNLRGMGGSRNLVLFDGHRIVPTTLLGGVQTGVDSNLFPTMLLKRVDIVTGGASAVYGSDAVSGVINYIVDNNFNGVKFNAQQSLSTYGDGRAYNLGIAAGTSLFDGRGHIEFSAQEINDYGVRNRWARDWGRKVRSMQGSVVGSSAGAGSINNPYALYENVRFSVTSFGGLINSSTCAANNPACNALAGLQFAQNGQLSTFNTGTRTGSAGAQIGGDGAFYNTYPAFGAQKQDLGLGRFDFNISDATKFYVEVVAGTVLNDNTLANAEVRSRTVGYNNAYLGTIQPQYRALLPANLQSGSTAIGTLNAPGSFVFSRMFTNDQVPASLNYARGRQYLYLAGLDGAWGDYKWTLGFEHSKATLTNTNPYNVSNARLFAAMNAVVDPNTGQIVCNAARSNPAYANCVPMNVFGPTATNQAAYDYIRQYTWYRVKSSNNDFTASISGAPLDNWAGPIDMAISGDYRRQTYGIDTNAQSTDPIDCNGIQFNCNTTTLAPYLGAVTNYFPNSAVKVSELAYEVQVPLLKDRFLAQSVAFNGAARYTNYSTSGVVWTWKAGLTWAMNDAFNIRATRSRDIRAPNIRDLYAPLSCNNISFTDVHTNNTPGTVSSCSQGNPDLQPEKADTYTVGIVWTPRAIEGLSVSLDGYHIDMSDSINSLSVTQPASQQACELSGGASPICAYYIRPQPYANTTSANYPSRVVNPTLNTGSLLTYGLDLEINYSHPLFGHTFSTRALVNYQPTYTIDQGIAGILYAGGAADSLAGLLNTPNVKGMLQVSYEAFENFTATVQERYRNALKQHASPTLYFSMGKMPPVWYTDLTLTYKMAPFGSDADLFLNVRNLFNQPPDPWAASGANAQIGSLGGYIPGDDIMGRYYTLGLRVKL